MIDSESDQIATEVLLLISSARLKNIDVSVWLTEDGNNGMTVAPDFNSKLISLGLIVGMREDGDKKNKFDHAISDSSLQRILSICGRGVDSLGEPLIDVTHFLRLCNRRLSKNSAADKSSLEYPSNDSADLMLTGPDSKIFIRNDRYKSNKDLSINAPSYRSDDRYHESAADYQFDKDCSFLDGNISFGGIMRGKDCSESSRLGDKYSDDSFNELKHANQWRIQKETSNTNLYLDENGNENKENINYDTNVKGLVNDIETNIASKKGTSRASSIPKNRPSKSSSKSAAQPSSRPLRSSSADPRNKRGLSGIKLAEQPTKSDSPQRAKRGSRDEWLATSDELQQMLIQDQKEHVEAHARNAVRQTDLYHLIQIHLGFIESYTMVPPRGEIVSSQPRTWLTIKDIQTAFMAGRVRFNDVQVYALAQLVNSFSKKYKEQHTNLLYSDAPLAADNKEKEDKDENMGTLDSPAPASQPHAGYQIPIIPLPKYAITTAGKINSEWLKRYLVHLRLSKRLNNTAVDSRSAAVTPGLLSQSLSKSRRSLSVTPLANRSINLSRRSIDNEKPTIRNFGESVYVEDTGGTPWLDWLSDKVARDRQAVVGKPMEFRKALAGTPHTLSTTDMNIILQAHVIIPKNVLEAEISHRINCWLFDTSGRKDFSHHYHIEIRKWEMKRKQECKILTDEDALIGLKSISRRITNDDRILSKRALRKELIENKRSELISSEKTNAVITSELYWKYDQYCRDNNYTFVSTWGVWLDKYKDTCSKQFKKFQDNNRERGRLCDARDSRKHSLGGLSEIQNKLSEAAKSLSTSHGIELKKSLVALRKSVLEKGTKNPLISKEEFDYHFENILAARASQLPENVRNLTIDIRKSYEELIKSKKSESTPVPAYRAIDSKSDKKIVKNKDEKLNDNDEEKENEYDDDDEFENENEIESVHMDDDNNVQEREQENDAVQTNIDSKTLPVERYNGDDIFLWNADNAVKRVLELKDEKDVQKQNDFSLWKNKKDTEMREKEEKDKLSKKLDEKEKLKKEKRARKAYNKWLRLRRDDKYISKFDGRKHSVPVVERVAHSVPWNAELDLNDYYAEVDKKYY